MARLSLNEVSKRFDKKTVVTSLSLDIEQGEFVALLGPSGCGKSTILRMIAGFEPVSSGNITHGISCLSSEQVHTPTEHRQFGMVFQSYALWPHMTVEQNVGYPLKIQKISGKERSERIQKALDIVQLSEFKQRFPNQLSGGQRQRVALARSLITEPDIILFDEPLANLDRHLRDSMEITFREFHRRTGATMIYVTHDQSEAMALADKIAVLKDGQLVQWSTPDTLYHQPENEWVANFIGQGTTLRCTQVPQHQVLDSKTVMQCLCQSEHKDDDQEGRLLIRPQHVTLKEKITETSLFGTVSECVFRGERYDVYLALSGNRRLHAYSDTPINIGEQRAFEVSQAWSLERSHAS
ncbi:ABC transporter ATP-binding protein [Marinomonas mediterranea]|jgi:ABC-type spermidine/putrescine transport systems, ATPase components|uniref:Polyamine-transporting ATPase n=1 Tax=Marinomonas mediterranea (strain ATCC 700492 / JCM 21426 / NBRC 103028 / MMB-1) TaxID=717774 RepID=F2JZN2_MARM1|nr:ABC transporter ATP-binding protein [Marinomonas mediterranea]ADZ90886.1 Polyamine-transporting ATPase [Marinomonas mediterranea MMB-1]WCN17035.1 ATP-binding cassette domain-containing protein [Marinomonas mediterranea MMB-1]